MILFFTLQGYYKQESIDTQVLASAFTTLLDGNLTRGYAPFLSDALYLRSYSLDPTNYYSYPLSSVDATVNSVSGYFDQVSCASIRHI